MSLRRWSECSDLQPKRKEETEEMPGRQEPYPAEEKMAKGAGRGNTGISSRLGANIKVEDLMRMLSISTSPGYQLPRFYGILPSREILEV